MARHQGVARRAVLKQIGGLGTLAAFLPTVSTLLLPFAHATVDATSNTPLLKPIPKTGEKIPAIGMGTWITFNVGDSVTGLANCTEILKAFFAAGGTVIDSSPMYGSSEQTVGHALSQLGAHRASFSATKVWTPFQSHGNNQISDSQRLWGIQEFDLLQIHNLVAWESHLETLQAMKAAGQVRYIGVTTSHGRRHSELEQILSSQPIDFVQLTYNVLDREAEQRLLPAASERGIAVIANRPFQRGALFERIGSAPLPAWASDIDCHNWAQFLLKFIVSHKAITCAIPATSQVPHMIENMGAMSGRLPDQHTRQRMADYVAAL